MALKPFARGQSKGGAPLSPQVADRLAVRQPDRWVDLAAPLAHGFCVNRFGALSMPADTPMTQPRVYLAGPDVFLPDARAIGAAKVAAAARHGLEGVFPLDAELDLTGLAPLEQARRISLANEALMRSCDAAVANLTPFRGVSVDSGTAFEVGFMRALGRPVAGYTAAKRDYAARCAAFRGAGVSLAEDFDGGDLEIEDFGLAENLMIGVAITDMAGAIEIGSSEPVSGIAAFAAFDRCLGRLAALLLDA
jgi:nucleoside 2-deoxyribosyltransferase